MASPEWLIEATLASSAAILVVLALRHPLRRAFGARVAYGAWGLVPATIFAVLLPAAEVGPQSVGVAAVPHLLAAVAQPGGAAPERGGQLAAAWIAGVLALAVTMAWRQRRFRRSLGRLSPGVDGVRVSEREIEGLPATLGLWSPQVVVPPAFDARYDAAQRELILAHERAHVQRGDVQANAVAAALRCLFWFNPLLHLAAPRFRQDQELACDATVLAAHPEARRRYGEALLQAQLSAQATPLGCHFGYGHPLRERIAMLREQTPSTSRRALGIAFVACLASGFAFAAWSAQPPQEAAKPKGAGKIQSASTPPPKYPAYAMEHNLGGLVVLRVDVAADGSVTRAVIERSEPKGIFDEAALAAVKQWKFEPGITDGKRVGGTVRVPIEFELDPADDGKAAPMKVGPGQEPDPAAYDWTRIDMDAMHAKEISCDVMKGNTDGTAMYCGILRK